MPGILKMLQDIKLVVFDLDGTIAELRVDWPGLRRELHDHFKINYDFDSDFTPFDSEIEKAGAELGDKALKEAYEIVERYELENIEKVTPIAGSVEIVRDLKRAGKTLAILSGNTRSAIELALGYLKIRKYFDIIVSKEDVRKHKPDPEGLFLIKDKVGVEITEVCLIGDRHTDMECAANANALAITIETALNYTAGQ